ncbi:Alpha-ketoglutarate-dependent dioxygenase AlkB [Pararobbsia alpina]|uniref:Alpha-ketoglutarate-dependent dioxygenase AlkB n=1 Tax=Pararobbsia alpina TaxID=621374 RepID=A0A6S7BNL4_9BURK|nr:Alpha-ketoglutarate-dependent dioxygenase AlkB [Pararobbsia alpina]
MLEKRATLLQVGWTTIGRNPGHLPTDVPPAAMPEVLRSLGPDAAAAVGFNDFAPDSILVSRASPGVPVSLHQEMNGPEGGAPVVAFTFGVPAHSSSRSTSHP